jgi:hypothetical protein
MIATNDDARNAPAPAFPAIDQKQLTAFVSAIFRHTTSGYIQLRAFRDDQDGTWDRPSWSAIRVTDGIDVLIKAAAALAWKCAKANVAVCFAPPVVTLTDSVQADEKHIDTGPALSVECDEHPQAARDRLVAVLGLPPTIEMLSGGDWVDPLTGEIEPKRHLHWRLAKPARKFAEHVALKEARRLAMSLAGGDPSAVPLVHPMRWPGSWHRKDKPRLATIIDHNPELEIDLDDALGKLKKAAANGSDHPQDPQGGGDPQGDGDDPEDREQMATLVRQLVSGEDYHSPIAQLAMRFLKAGMADGQCVETLRGLMLAVDPNRRNYKGGALVKDRWESRYRDIPRAVATARAKLADAPQPEPPADQPWPKIDAEAFHGLAGRIVDTIDPITEADPVAVLAQTLAAFSCAFGRGAYCLVGDTKHYPNIFEIICGTTSKGRKGTSYDPVESLITRADPTFGNCVKSGLASGEGIIHAVHDGAWVRERITHGRGQAPTYTKVLKEEPIADKRLLVVEQEFASLLATIERQGNSLSPVLRLGWDGRKLQTMTKHNAESATGAHLSLVGHITTDELQVLLNEVAMANGFGNRFLFVLARRSKELPFPGRLDPATADRLAGELHKLLTTLDWRRNCVEFSPAARDLWVAEYHELSSEKPGLLGSITARAEAQTLRLAMIFALLDATYLIQPNHLRAALAFWRYCDASAKYIFGDFLGNPIADNLLRALRQAGPGGKTRTELRDLFQHHSARLAEGLTLLLKYGKAEMKKRTGTAGRSAEIWIAT